MLRTKSPSRRLSCPTFIAVVSTNSFLRTKRSTGTSITDTQRTRLASACVLPVRRRHLLKSGSSKTLATVMAMAVRLVDGLPAAAFDSGRVMLARGVAESRSQKLDRLSHVFFGASNYTFQWTAQESRRPIPRHGTDLFTIRFAPAWATCAAPARSSDATHQMTQGDFAALTAADQRSQLHPFTSIAEHLKHGPHIITHGKGIYIFDQHGKSF